MGKRRHNKVTFTFKSLTLSGTEMTTISMYLKDGELRKLDNSMASNLFLDSALTEWARHDASKHHRYRILNMFRRKGTPTTVNIDGKGGTR